MLTATSRKAASLALAGTLLAGLFCFVSLAPAQTTKDAKDKAAKEDKGKEKDKGKEPVVKLPAKLPPFKMVFATKDTDLPEMKKSIDDKVARMWDENKVLPTAYCDDHEFIRRASLDVVGRIAKPEEIDRFMKDAPEKRRSELIERLLKHEDY